MLRIFQGKSTYFWMLLTANWEPISFNSKVGASSNSLNKEKVFLP